MGKNGSLLNKISLIAILLACVLFLSLSAITLTSTPANAVVGGSQTSDSMACNSPCVFPQTFVSAIVAVGLSIMGGISEVTTDVSTTISLVTSVETATIVAQITFVMEEFTRFFHDLWYKKTLVQLQKMSNQLVTLEADQARYYGSFSDAKSILGLKNLREKMAIKSDREHRLGASAAIAATITGGMTRAAVLKNQYRNAATRKKSPRSAGKAGASYAGVTSDLEERWKNYTTLYCRKDYNNEVSGCDEDMPYADMDINVTRTLFFKETINLTNENMRTATDDLVTNIAEPLALNITSSASIKGIKGQANILRKESYKAKRQTVYDALYHVISRRAPGGNIAEFLGPLRESAGLPYSEISTNPSYNEIMHTMTTERFRTGIYSYQQIDEPENNKRELVIQQAFHLMQLNDQLDLLDRQALILAAQIGDSIKKAKPLSSGAKGGGMK